MDLRSLREEQAIIGQAMTLCIQQAQLESELRQGLTNIGESLRIATDAARAHITTAAGGAEAVKRFPFACRPLSMLARYSRPLPATETIRLLLGQLVAALQAMDAAMGSLDEIRFDACHRA